MVIKKQTIHPKILYYGNPVVLLTTANEDGTTNISPISSSWALGHMLVLGLGTDGKAYENLERQGECVLNLPGPDLWTHVERLASCTGKEKVPLGKEAYGCISIQDKFGYAGLIRQPSAMVDVEAVAQCPLHIEAQVMHIRKPDYLEGVAIVEVEALTVQAHKDILEESNHHIDPSVFSPLIYNFRHYFQLGNELGKTVRA
ncbi:flavin reductase family protein [Terribacillus halophilus]|jgi:flavin reductase (DIM6/NTAB) family NADH-FMN oxidoreductase RutF|uniref:flavin reductase family protein n=1 Tax=Terribacillus halophilus TaxID=361279 RepID=UPI0009879E9F|nr:flavin reductase family protein [Terribacillus halophilus]